MPQKINYPLPSYPQVMVITKAPPGVPQGPSVNRNDVFLSVRQGRRRGEYADAGMGLKPCPGDRRRKRRRLFAGARSSGAELCRAGGAELRLVVHPRRGQCAAAHRRRGEEWRRCARLLVPANAVGPTTGTGPLWLSQWNPASQCPMLESPASQLAALKAIVAIDEALIAALEKAA